MAGMRLVMTVGALLVTTLVLRGQVADRTQADLQAAIKLELVDGNLKAAVEQFKVLTSSSRPEIAAEALIHLAACYDKLGRPTEARAAYERVVRDYPSQTQPFATARAWLQANPSSPGGPGSTRPGGLSADQLWTGRGVSYISGRPSADGRYVAFVDWSSGFGNLAVRDLSTGTSRLLTKDASSKSWAANALISPDGRQVFYRAEGGPDESIRVINTDGTRLRVIKRQPYGDFLSDVSPDGRYLAGVRRNYSTDLSSQIILISTADGAVTTLKSVPWRDNPAIGGFSPDGRFLVYSLNDDSAKGRILALATDGSHEAALVQGSSNNWAPIWSPDGTQVVFMSDRSGAPDLWAIRVAEGQGQEEPVRLRPGQVGFRPLSIVRDGSLFYRAGATWTDIHSADFDERALTLSRPMLVADQFVGTNMEPALSPDGNSVAFLRRITGRGPGAGRALVVRSLADGSERSVTTGPLVSFGRIQWLPDSRSLVVIDGGATPGQGALFRVIDVATGAARTLLEVDGGVWNTFALSSDARFVYYTTFLHTSGPGPTDLKRLRLMKHDIERRAARELYTTESTGLGFFGLTVSADSQRLAFFVHVEGMSKHSLMVMSADGGTPKEIYRPAFGDLSHLGAMIWTKDGSHLVVTGKCGPGGWQFCAIPSEGGTPRPLGLAMDAASRMLSADGRRIVFSSGSTSPELWVMRNVLPAGK